MNVLHDIPKLNKVPLPKESFIDRKDEVKRIVNALKRDQAKVVSAKICLVYGTPGTGKTELCRAAVHQLRKDYPDGQLYISVDKQDSPRVSLFKIVETVIHIFDPYAPVSDDLKTMGSQYNSIMEGRRVLIVLDGLPSGSYIDLLARPALCGLLITTSKKTRILAYEMIALRGLSQTKSEKLLTYICPRLGDQAADLAKICKGIPTNLCLIAGFLNYNQTIVISDFVSKFERGRKQYVGLKNNLTDGIVTFLLNQLPETERDFFLQLSVLSISFDKLLAKEVFQAASNDDVSLVTIQTYLDKYSQINLIAYDTVSDCYSMTSSIQDYGRRRLRDAPETWYRLGNAFAESIDWYNSFAKRGADDYLLGLLMLDERKSTIKSILRFLLRQTSVDRDRILVEFRDLLYLADSTRFAPRLEKIPLLEAILEASMRLHEGEKTVAILGDLSRIYAVIDEKQKSLYYSRLQNEVIRDNSGKHKEKAVDSIFRESDEDKQTSGLDIQIEPDMVASAVGDLTISESRVILTGFMGTGKTTVGKLLAETLGYRFIDTDELIEAKYDRSISDIFQELGEDAFREMERSIVREIAGLDDVVISTGGRLMLDPENVIALSRNSRVLCLVATPDEILTRVKNDKAHKRPLLEVPYPQERIVELLQKRNDDYLRFPQVVTDEKKPADIAKSLAEFVNTGPKSLVVENPQESYEYVVGAGLLPFLRQLTGIHGEVVIITDQDVKKIYGPSCASTGKTIEIPSGPQHKSMDTVKLIYSRLLQDGFDRSGTIVALGGSLVGDVAGYVAATYMRGVNLIHCPTSLIAMVDTSVGGKVSIDLPEGKNLIGVYKQPAKVIADVATLHTLPQQDFVSGMAEVIKHGLIAESSLLEQVELGHWSKNWDRSPSYIGELQRLVAQAIQVKINIVQADPFEQGLRSILNLGHTFAYAIEQVSNNAYRHGEAVSMGLVAAANLSERLGFCDTSLQKRIEAVLASVNLPTRIPVQIRPDALLQAMQSDKKKQAGQLRFILVREIGQVFVSDAVPDQKVLDTISSLSTAQS